MTLYVIGVGGSGAKCLESIIQVASIGLFDEESIKILFVDADETNGNLDRAKISLGIYEKCYQLMKGAKDQYSWLKTPIKSYDVWSPFAETSTNKNLGAFFHYSTLKQNNPALGNLFDVLYTKKERDDSLDVGFRGRPAIGAAIMSQVDLDSLDQEPWSSLIGQIQQDTGGGKSVQVLLCGSIFGGTGASGIPTIGRLIANKLDEQRKTGKLQIGCLFLLPYFGFQPDASQDVDGVYARSEEFLLNTEAALRYYNEQGELSFDAVYLLGNQNFSQFKFSIGKNTQMNDPHFVELYGALAARHFVLNSQQMQRKISLISRTQVNIIYWKDLPDGKILAQELVNATRFAYCWLGNIVPELETAKKMGVGKFLDGAPWFGKFYKIPKVLGTKNPDFPELSEANQQQAITIISDWCKDFFRWLSDIHKCDGENISLLKYQLFSQLDGRLQGEHLADLMVGDDRSKDIKDQDTIDNLKKKLEQNQNTLNAPNQGTAGLAKALYINSRI